LTCWASTSGIRVLSGGRVDDIFNLTGQDDVHLGLGGILVSERAAVLHENSLVMLSHCHELLPEDIERMRAGGIAAKLLVATLDGRMFCEPEEWRRSLDAEHGFLSTTLVVLDYLNWLAERPGAEVLIAREPEDIEGARRTGKVALVVGSEGSKFLEGRVEVLRVLYRLGLRYFAPMWYYDSAIGTAQENRSGEGLTAWGRSVVAEANRLGLLLDGNHMSDQSLRDTLETSARPILVSHSGARELNPEQLQLLPDDLMRDVAAAGGVIGIMFQSLVVKPGHSPATKDDLKRQFSYCVDLVGADHIACGPDYHLRDPRVWQGNNPTGPMPEPISWAVAPDASRFAAVTEMLLELGWSDVDVAKILGGNLLRLFADARRGAADPPIGDYADAGAAPGTITDGLTAL
jgi:microsomal dipeptidase-like Zn-dependent dipeptidase